MKKKLIFIIFSVLLSQHDVRHLSTSNIDKLVKQAQAFERANMPSEAEVVYKSILNEDPNNIFSIKKLKNIYRANKNINGITHLLNRYDYHEISDPMFLTELMELSIWSQNENWIKIADKVFAKYIKEPKVVTLLIGRLINNSLIDNALLFIEKFREKNNKLDFYSMELGVYYSSKMEYKKSIAQYLLNLKYNQKNYRIISNRIMIFPDEHIIQDKIKDILRNSSIKNAQIILSDLEFRSGNIDASYDLLLKYHTNVEELIEFAEQIRKIQLYDKSIDIYTNIINNNYSNKINNKALLGIGMCLEKKSFNPKYILPISSSFERNSFLECPIYEIDDTLMKSIWDAIAIYDSLSYISVEAAMKLADIKFKGIKDLDSALNIYQELMDGESPRKIKLNAGISLIDVLIVKGDLNTALIQAQNLSKKYKREDEINIIKIKELQINFLLGDLDATSEKINFLLKALSKNDLRYNDILDLKNIVLLFNDDNNAFADYAYIQLLIYQNKNMQAIENLNLFIENYSSLIADVAIYQLSFLLLSFDDIKNAFHQLELISNSDIYLEMSSILKAEIYDYIIDDKEKAVNVYLNVLYNYPLSIHYDSIRYRLRKIAS